MEFHGIRFHQYVDDTQVRSLVPSQMEAHSHCVSALTFRFLDSELYLNSTKSEVIILGSRQGLSKLELVVSLDISDGQVEVRDEIKILGVHLDPTLSMNAQVKSLIKTSNFHICALQHVHRGLTFESAKMIALGLVTSRPDYCNSLLYGTSKANIGRLHRVQNDLGRVLLQAAWNSSSKPLLEHLNWLPVQQRIIFKIALVTFNVRTFEQPFLLLLLLHLITHPTKCYTNSKVRVLSEKKQPKTNTEQVRLLVFRKSRWTNCQVPQFDRQLIPTAGTIPSPQSAGKLHTFT